MQLDRDGSEYTLAGGHVKIGEITADTFDETVRSINEQEVDCVQGKYLKARDVAALQENAACRLKAKTAPL